eukprot:256355-Chlamydomonas_euryale.AAC.9
MALPYLRGPFAACTSGSIGGTACECASSPTQPLGAGTGRCPPAPPPPPASPLSWPPHPAAPARSPRAAVRLRRETFAGRERFGAWWRNPGFKRERA